MCRKQPTPTDILENPSLTEMDKLVFFYIRPRVRNSDWVITFTHAKKEYVVNMKRWQCIFKASAFSELVNKDVKYFRKSLQRINDFYSKVDIEQKPYWYLISRLYYDDLTRMDNERIMKGEWKDNEGRANKSDKKEKENITDNLDFFSNEVKDVFIAFIDIRKKREKWLSDIAIKNLHTNLHKLSQDWPTQIAIINNSITNNWKWLFQLREELKKYTKTEYLQIEAERERDKVWTTAKYWDAVIKKAIAVYNENN